MARKSWHSHCDVIDTLWDEYLNQLLAYNGNLDTSYLVKPSGPFGAVLHTQWSVHLMELPHTGILIYLRHYPTFATKHSNLRFGHVMDPSNRSLYHQFRKLASPPSILASDMFPLRGHAKNPKWFQFDNWENISKLSVAFNYALMKASSIVVLVGRTCFDEFDKCLRGDQTIHLTKVLINTGIQVFTRQPFFYVVYQNDAIKQLVFYVQHGSRFTYGADLKEALYADLV